MRTTKSVLLTACTTAVLLAGCSTTDPLATSAAKQCGVGQTTTDGQQVSLTADRTDTTGAECLLEKAGFGTDARIGVRQTAASGQPQEFKIGTSTGVRMWIYDGKLQMLLGTGVIK